MHTRVLKPKHGPTLYVRPLRHGAVRTVLGLFERLGDESRRTHRRERQPRALALLRRIANVLDISLDGPEFSIRAAIA